MAALDKIMEVLDEEPEVIDAAGAKPLSYIEGHVRFEGVRFGYGDGPEVLHGLDLDVQPGTTVALVGHTGAGESTIAKLLARFYDPRESRITIDGTDLRAVTQASLRKQLGIVPQEGFLFAGTLRENIAFARPDASPEDVMAAAQAVGADVFARELEDGYETQLGERGVRLSLGQRQLVAFARALLADPRILILDEATSSVDVGTERRIELALRRLLTGRTAFVIAHRLSTIRGADFIVVLEHGRVVEQERTRSCSPGKGSTHRSTATGPPSRSYASSRSTSPRHSATRPSTGRPRRARTRPTVSLTMSETVSGRL